MSKRHLLTSGELAEELGIAPRTVARYVRDGWLVPAETTMGGHYRFDLDDVRRQIREIRERRQADD